MWIDGQFECFTLEPACEEPVNPGHPAIPAGTYSVILTPSPHLKYITPEVLNVPGRSAIRWHIANKPEELLGCVAVGMTQALDWVGGSTQAFDRMMILLRSADKISATYIDPPFVPLDPEISV
jgi:hypothetical protein